MATRKDTKPLQTLGKIFSRSVLQRPVFYPGRWLSVLVFRKLVSRTPTHRNCLTVQLVLFCRLKGGNPKCFTLCLVLNVLLFFLNQDPPPPPPHTHTHTHKSSNNRHRHIMYIIINWLLFSIMNEDISWEVIMSDFPSRQRIDFVKSYRS